MSPPIQYLGHHLSLLPARRLTTLAVKAWPSLMADGKCCAVILIPPLIPIQITCRPASFPESTQPRRVSRPAPAVHLAPPYLFQEHISAAQVLSLRIDAPQISSSCLA